MADATLDFNPTLLIGTTSRRKIGRTSKDMEAVYANVEREWLGSVLLTGLPSLGTHSRLVGRQHDRNMFSFGTVQRVLDAEGEARWASGLLAPSDGLELMCNPRWADAMVRSRSTQQGQNRREVLAATDKLPRVYLRGTPFTSLAYGCHEVNADPYEHINLRPYSQLCSRGGREYGTYVIEDADPTMYWGDGDGVPTSKAPLKYKHDSCYGEAATGAIYDCGLQVSLHSKNSVVGDTSSVPSGHLNPCGWAVMSNTGDSGQVANFKARVYRYFRQGIFTSDQRQEESSVDVYDRDFLTDYTWLVRMGEAGSDFGNDPGLGTYAYLMSELWFGGLRGAASWVDDTVDWNMHFEVAGVDFAASGSFGDKRIRSSLIAEWANGSKDTDLNLISHAAILPCLRPGFAPESQIKLEDLGRVIAWSRVFSEDAVDASCRILKSAVSLSNHATELAILDHALRWLKEEEGIQAPDAGTIPSPDWMDDWDLSPDAKTNLYPSFLFLEASDCGRVSARRYEVDPSSDRFEFTEGHGGLDQVGFAYMDYSFDGDIAVFGELWQYGHRHIALNSHYRRNLAEGLSSAKWGNPMAYCKWSPIGRAEATTWTDLVQELADGVSTFRDFHPFTVPMTSFQAYMGQTGYWASLAEGRDAIACSWYNATGSGVDSLFPKFKPVPPSKLQFSSETAVYHPVYKDGRYEVNPYGGSQEFARVGQNDEVRIFTMGAFMSPAGLPGRVLSDNSFARLLGNIGPVQALLTSQADYDVVQADSGIIIYAFTRLWAPAVLISGEV